MERLDDVLGYKDLKIYQNSDYFSFSLDSIILANYSTIRLRDKRIVDFCTGNGVVPIIIPRRCNKDIVGVEIQEKIASLAIKSIKYNHLDERISIVCDDVKNFSRKHLNEFDLLLCNPPYFKVQELSTFNKNDEKTIARHELYLNLDELCDCAKKILKDNGNFCLVHRSERLNEIIQILKKYNLEVKRIKFVHETVEKPSFLVYIEAQKCGKPGLIVDKPLIQYELDGRMTAEYDRLQREVIM